MDVHEIDLEGRHHLRTRQRAGQGLQRDRGPRRLAAPGARQGWRTHPVPAPLRGLRQDHRLRAHRQGLRRRRAHGHADRRGPRSRCPEERSREIDVVEFVPSDQLDPIMFERSYFLEPDSKSIKAYVLLRRTLEETDRTAIVQFALRQKTRLGALRVRGDVLMLQSLLWDDEVREASLPVARREGAISPKELEDVERRSWSRFAATSSPTKFTDDYQEQLRELIDAKLEEGRRPSTPRRPSARRRRSRGRRRGARPHGGPAAQRREEPRRRGQGQGRNGREGVPGGESGHGVVGGRRSRDRQKPAPKAAAQKKEPAKSTRAPAKSKKEPAKSRKTA